MNICPTCGLDFSSVAAFDDHRVGTHDYTYSEGVAMDPMREDGRRCLHLDEMKSQGWRRDRWDRWQSPIEHPSIERVTL
jgi:hypothetical protein